MARQSENAGLTALFRDMRRWGRLTEIVVQRLTRQLIRLSIYACKRKQNRAPH